jgi:hypothetical protein
MRKFLKGRPSPAMVVAMIALIAGLGGGAYAATTKKKITYKTLDKDARNKVLPLGATKAITADCDPNAVATYTECATVSITQSTAFPRKTMVVVDGTFTTPAAGARGECRIEVDNAPVTGARARIGENGAGGHVNENGDGFGINTITTKLGGKHTYSVDCNEVAGGDLKIHDLQLSAIGIRG